MLSPLNRPPFASCVCALSVFTLVYLFFGATSSQAEIQFSRLDGGVLNWSASGNLADDTPSNNTTEDLIRFGYAPSLGSPASNTNSIVLRRDQNVTLTAAPGETVTLNLRNFRLAGSSTFTLEGTATSTFIINVTGQFSLCGRARVVLSSGVLWDHVFFNVLGRNSTVSLRKYASFVGILTAADRIVRLRGHSVVYGKVIANQVVLSGAAQIIPPPITSP